MERSCADCVAIACEIKDNKRPAFCQSDQANHKEMIAAYEGEDLAIMQAASEAVMRVGREGLCRIEETMAFARNMGYRKIGIANCAALVSESHLVAKILRLHGFEVFGVSCKFGELKIGEFFEDASECSNPNGLACNPIIQAQRLNEQGTDFNLIVGLCVGHDALFAKHSNAPVSTLIAKDRILANNPASALYTSGHPAMKWSRLLRQDDSFSPLSE